MSRYKKVLKKRSGYSYIHPKTGERIRVESHTQHYRVRKYKKISKISKKKAEKEFEKRPQRSQTLDKKYNAKQMFGFPTLTWKNAINVYDIWGIDGTEPPEVDELPEIGFPYQVVTYKGDIYWANEDGYFEKQVKPKEGLLAGYNFEEYDSPQKRERFKELTSKNVIWNDEVTKQYKDWLEYDYKFEKIADRLNPETSNLNLYEIQEFYDSLPYGKDKLKQIMYKLYNDYYANDIKSYTKDFQEFYNRRYLDILDQRIQKEKKRLKEKTKDPKKVEQALENYYSEKMINFRKPTIRKMLNSRNYAVISDFDIEQTLGAYPQWENEDIVNDLIQRYKEGDLIDTDIPLLDEAEERDKEEWKKMKQKYEHYLDFETAKEIEDEYKHDHPNEWKQMKEEEKEQFGETIGALDDINIEEMFAQAGY